MAQRTILLYWMAVCVMMGDGDGSRPRSWRRSAIRHAGASPCSIAVAHTAVVSASNSVTLLTLAGSALSPTQSAGNTSARRSSCTRRAHNSVGCTEIFNYRALCYLALGDVVNSLADARRALEVSPLDPVLAVNASQVCLCCVIAPQGFAT